MKKKLATGLLLIFCVTLFFTYTLAKDNDFAWLGVATQTVDDELADAFDLDIDYGAIVNDVINNSPAEKAGLQEDDIIIAFNSDKIYDYNDLVDYLEDSAPEETITLSILRDNKKMDIQVMLEKAPRNSYRNYGKHNSREYFPTIPPIPPIPAIPSLPSLHSLDALHDLSDGHGNCYSYTTGNSAYIGVHLAELSDQLRKYFGIENKQGVLVSEVEKDSPAEKAGILAGDIIILADKYDISDYRDLKETIEDKKDGDIVSITLMRDKNKKQFDVVVAEHEDNNSIFFNAPDISMRVPHGKSHSTFFSDDLNEFFNSDEFEDGMRELKKELENLKFELKDEMKNEFNSHEFKREMKKLKKELKNEESIINKELKTELEKLKKEMKELEKRIDD